MELSAGGEAALKRALSVAHWYGAELHAAYVRPGRAAAGTTGADDPFVRRLTESITKLNTEHVPVTPVVLAGDPVDAVAEYSARKSADLVVVGRNGRRGSRLWWSGLLAAELARRVECPTLTVSKTDAPDTELSGPFKNILCAVDFSPASLRALNEALTVAQQSGGRIVLLHVLEGFPYESVYSGSRALRLIEEYDALVAKVRSELLALVPRDVLNSCEVETEVVSGVAHDAIVAAATARTSDLVVIGLPRRTRLDRIVMASTASGVLRHVPSAVLTIPGPSRTAEGTLKAGAHQHEGEAIAMFT
jgi:nucleotide-binding universal stress UspA family protein